LHDQQMRLLRPKEFFLAVDLHRSAVVLHEPEFLL
jgi:hypothetical protein